jgi:hypothetical protein
MLISDSHQFIFVQMRKAASSSIQSQLSPYVLPRPVGRWAHLKSRARLEWDYRKYVFRTHDDILAARRRMPAEKFQAYFKFAFVRNPWERLVSEYEYIRSRPDHGRHRRVMRLGSFEAFVRMQIPRRDAYQLHMLRDREGALLVDYVGKVETLDQDWRYVCDRLGIPHSELPRRNMTRHRPYRDYFDASLGELVARHWGPEIRLFDYAF